MLTLIVQFPTGDNDYSEILVGSTEAAYITNHFEIRKVKICVLYAYFMRTLYALCTV